MSDFDPNDIINEDVPVSDFDVEDLIDNSQINNQLEQEEAPITISGVPIIEPTIGYAAGRAAQEAISKTGEWAGRGLEKIAEVGGTSPEQLRLIKQNFPEFRATDPIDEMNKLLATARGTNVDVNRMYEEAKELLIDKKITPDEYKNIVEKAILEHDKYGRPTFAKPISQSEISKTLQPAIESTEKIVKSKEEKLLQEFADLKAKQAVTQASQQYLGVLPEDTEKQIIKQTKEQVLQNPQAFDFQSMKASEVLPIYQQERAGLISQKETKLSDMFPSLKGTSIVPAEERTFQKILGLPSTADISGDELQQFMRTAREQAFLEDGNLSDKPSAAFGAETRKKISELSPEAGKLMEAENVEIKKLDALENAGYIKREGSGIKTTVEMTDAQRNKLVRDLATAYDGVSPTDVVENLETLKNYLSPEDFKKLKLAGIKMAEKRGGGVDYINANKINAILQSITKRSVSRGVATLPEAVSTALPKAVTSTAKFLGRGAYKALPAMGAGIGGIAAQAAEEALNPEVSGATPSMPEYWLERGVRDPEEQRQRAMLASFRSGLPNMGRQDEMPSPYEKPEIRERKEQVMTAKKAGALAPTYVEAPKIQVLKPDNVSEITSYAQTLQSSQDRVAQEYGRVLSQVASGTPRERESLMFGLNQQPAFRKLIRQLRGDEEEESP